MNSPNYILEGSNFDFRYVRLCGLDIPREKWLSYLQTVETHFAASDLGLHCFPNALFGDYTLQWVKVTVLQRLSNFSKKQLDLL